MLNVVFTFVFNIAYFYFAKILIGYFTPATKHVSIHGQMLTPRKGTKRKFHHSMLDNRRLLFDEDDTVLQPHFNDTDHTDMGKLY